MTTHVLVVLVAILVAGAGLGAHTLMIKGTVQAIESKRIQVKTGEEKKGETPEWILLNAKTKYFRDKTTVSQQQAKIVAGERVVVSADHDAKGVMTALEVHLAAR
jgi:hypothetical protein